MNLANTLSTAAAITILIGCNGQAQQQVPSIFGSSNSFNNSFNNNTCTAFGSGNTIVCDPPRAEFSEQSGEELISHMPDKKKTVALLIIGGDADFAVGAQYYQFLKSKGYKVDVTRHNNEAVPPEHPFVLQTTGAQYEVTVAPSAHR